MAILLKRKAKAKVKIYQGDTSESVQKHISKTYIKKSWLNLIFSNLKTDLIFKK